MSITTAFILAVCCFGGGFMFRDSIDIWKGGKEK